MPGLRDYDDDDNDTQQPHDGNDIGSRIAHIRAQSTA